MSNGEPARTFLILAKEYKTRFNLSDREYDAIMEKRHIAMSHIPNDLRIYKDIQFFEEAAPVPDDSDGGG